ncbi:MAG: carboxylating nicotinate-nucleotide diphosphorylase [Actinomycetota bacterium]|nr:carboxylating nicotinate-nucleotide diphosphorylase [Actinomycetota bacterium]
MKEKIMENKILKNDVIDIIHMAIFEDLGSTGDITSQFLVPPDKKSFSYIICKEKKGAVLSGLDIAVFTMEEIDSKIKVERFKKDGDRLEYDDRICNISGPVLSILKAERTCLNFIQHMSGIATLTAEFVKIAEPYGVKIKDTRKTNPALRKIEKYAVLCGGGCNHRFGLFDGILIKDNHIAAAGGILKAVEKIRAAIHPISPDLKIEVEVGDLNQLDEALKARADIIMLDNMNAREMTEAVKIIREKGGNLCEVEASGNITLKNINRVCKTGVDTISIGAITHSAPAIDFSMEFEY